ncbi:MAG: hypothetical protein HQK53_10095 [Oligoflexia bacterium]|nr:hypothetical protein [Oligoflexia bacterium]
MNDYRSTEESNSAPGKELIIVPSDGASNIKLSAYDFFSLQECSVVMTETPAHRIAGVYYNDIAEELAWFKNAISNLKIIGQEKLEKKKVAVISPVARGASGALIADKNRILDHASGKYTLAYTQPYSDKVNQQFLDFCGDAREFFIETGSIATYPGCLTLLKRILFEEMERASLLFKAQRFIIYPLLIAGDFLGGNYLQAAQLAGNEHSYWMCHTGARNIHGSPGTLSRLCKKITSYSRLVPAESAICYRSIGVVQSTLASKIKLSDKCSTLVTAGGHDTSFSHIPIIASFYQQFPHMQQKEHWHLEIGTWIMGALLGDRNSIDKSILNKLFGKGIVIQGSVDGNPIITTMYAGGADFKFLKKLVEDRGIYFGHRDPLWNFERTMVDIAKEYLECEERSCFVMPNMNPSNFGHGPFPEIRGKIINEEAFLYNGERAFVFANLMSALITAYQLMQISPDPQIPIVITGGGAKNPLFGQLLATITRKDVYTIFNHQGDPLVETTSLGAAMVGKAAVLNIHPYDVDLSVLGISYRKSKYFNKKTLKMFIEKYQKRYFKLLSN